MPPLPPPGQAALIRVSTVSARQAARQELRSVLREVLSRWSGLSSDQVGLQETARGPVCPQALRALSLNISLAYTEGEGWIGLLCGGRIGIDAAPIRSIPEADAVALLFLGAERAHNIRRSSDPALAFAIAWTELEACLKCAGKDLTEWSSTDLETVYSNCTTHSLVFAGDRILTVATGPLRSNV
jgi:4'-phosphopantetheinyl transferase